MISRQSPHFDIKNAKDYYYHVNIKFIIFPHKL